jgi:hypothetical protein
VLIKKESKTKKRKKEEKRMTSMNSLVLKALFNFSISILISTSIKIFSVM